MRPAVRLLLLAVALGALLVAGLVLVPRDGDRIRAAVEDAGAWAPAAFVAGTAVLVVAFFPFPVLAGAGGVLFGAVGGAALALAGELIGAVASFLFARTAGREATERIAGERLAGVLAGVGRRGFSAVLLVRVLPGIPRHPANYAFGLTPVRLPTFVLATALGGAPRAFGYAALGGSLGDLTSPESAAAVAGLAVVGLLGIWLGARDPELRAALRAAAAGRRGGVRGP